MSTIHLASLLSKRLLYIKQLATLARRQYEVIQENDITKLLEVLARKEYMLYEIGLIETELSPYKNEDPDARVWNSEEDRLHAAGVIEQTKQIMAYIREMEQVCHEEAVRQKEQLEQQAKRMDSGATIVGAYAKQNTVTRGVLLDIK